MTRLTHLRLTVGNPAGIAAFFCQHLGMGRVDEGGTVAVGYPGYGAKILLMAATDASPYTHDASDRYWKIAITVPNLDHACAELRANGVETTDPRQFREIAYMAHLADPEGHVVELLQHTFDGEPKTRAIDPDQPLGGGAQLGLVTWRTDDLMGDAARCRGLGLRLLSRQTVADRGFDLYFFGGMEDEPPQNNVNAVANRQWLWQRPYTVLEFQHRLNEVVDRPKESSVSGAANIRFENHSGGISEFR